MTNFRERHMKNQRGKSRAAVLCLLLALLILAVLVVTSCFDVTPAVYEGPLTQRTLGPMKLDQGKQYLIFLEAPIGFGMNSGASRAPTSKRPKLPQVVALYDSSGSAIRLVALDYIYKYYGSGKCGISVAGFQARESGVHYYEVIVDRLAWEKFAEESDWASTTAKAVNKIIIREAAAVSFSWSMNFIICFAIFAGIVVYIISATRTARKAKQAKETSQTHEA